ncbi:Putative F-box/LRR-repeat protein [Arachis hypogaea]|uniref:F-box/LRR-repeat protein n=1 Tax=Arachis hypogaea TaxID=3818 RepID=A0A6B9VB13_ARAHY|nr:Putative F-box/LRR-repeat protein [Arachis hypogaea]
MVILYRQCQLRRLRLVQCYFYNITEEGLCEIAQKLSLLEELDITLCSRVSSVTLEAIGRGCPLLKSFKFNDIVYSFIGGNNDEAFAIAQNMPNLRHLQLVKNRLDNDGVSAILDSCRCLESLDLYWCYNANLEGRLRKMCDKQLKDFIEPNTPDDFRDYKYIERCCYESWYYDFTMDYNSHGKDYYNESQGNGELSEDTNEEKDWDEIEEEGREEGAGPALLGFPPLLGSPPPSRSRAVGKPEPQEKEPRREREIASAHREASVVVVLIAGLHSSPLRLATVATTKLAVVATEAEERERERVRKERECTRSRRRRTTKSEGEAEDDERRGEEGGPFSHRPSLLPPLPSIGVKAVAVAPCSRRH